MNITFLKTVTGFVLCYFLLQFVLNRGNNTSFRSMSEQDPAALMAKAKEIIESVMKKPLKEDQNPYSL